MAFRWPWNREERAALSGLGYPAPWMGEAFGAIASPSGKRVSVRNAIGIAPVWAAVSMISEQVGQLPLKVYKDLDEDTRVEATQHRAWSMLHDRPNSHTPAGRFWATTTVHLLMWGNAFVLKIRDGYGLVDELRLLQPERMVVYWNPDTGEKTFIYQPINGNRQEYSQDDVLHIFGLSMDGIIGESVIKSCAASFGAALARDEFEGSFYNRGAVLSGVIQTPDTLKNDDAIKRLKTSFSSVYGGSSKAHQVAVLENGAEFKPMSHPLRDLEFVAAQQLSRTDIAVMFKLPPNYLGGASGDSLTYATVESNQAQFALHAIAPWTATIAQAISQDPAILPQNIFTAEFVLDAMLRADSAARADFYQKMSSIKAITPNEIRSRENLPPVPWGDEPIVPEQARETLTDAAAPTNLDTPDGSPPDGSSNGAGKPPASVNGNANGNGRPPALQGSENG